MLYILIISIFQADSRIICWPKIYQHFMAVSGPQIWSCAVSYPQSSSKISTNNGGSEWRSQLLDVFMMYEQYAQYHFIGLYKLEKCERILYIWSILE